MDVSCIAMSELIGYGNRTLLNGRGEIGFCQRRPNLGPGEWIGPEIELRLACPSIRKVRIALFVRFKCGVEIRGRNEEDRCMAALFTNPI
ncbi:MAG: hypothetical protein CBARDMAM_4830 [uncultured Caballeronia sp.]|nr:MAG: hypothetical protein CBARDMAM_4830 [uncultured Caballeronia sp.]